MTTVIHNINQVFGIFCMLEVAYNYDFFLSFEPIQLHKIAIKLILSYGSKEKLLLLLF